MKNSHFQRNTRQRQVILDELCKLTSHPTAAALYEIVRRRLPKISLGTVYRNLELMAQTHMIRKLDGAGGQSRFDGNASPHEHVRCVRCGRVGDVSGQSLELPPGYEDDCGGYRILGHRLELLGVCPDCIKLEREVS